MATVCLALFLLLTTAKLVTWGVLLRRARRRRVTGGPLLLAFAGQLAWLRQLTT